MIGTGHIAKKFKEAISGVPDAKLVAVASRNINKAKAFNSDLNDVVSYGSYQQIVNDDEIDVVYIATPHPYHKENALMCLENNKAVLCEKPFTLNAKDAKEVYQVAKNKKLFLMEAMWTKFLPVIKKVKQWVNENKIGEIKIIKADFGFFSTIKPENRLFNKQLAGGALLDIGIYPITFASIFLGLKPMNILSECEIGKTDVDFQNAIILKYPKGKLAILSSTIQTDLTKEAIIFGTKGKIVVPEFWKAERAYLYQNQRLIEEYQKPFIKNGFEYEINQVNTCLKKHKINSHTHKMEDTIKVLEIMDYMRKEWNLKYPME